MYKIYTYTVFEYNDLLMTVKKNVLKITKKKKIPMNTKRGFHIDGVCYTNRIFDYVLEIA